MQGLLQQACLLVAQNRVIKRTKTNSARRPNYKFYFRENLSRVECTCSDTLEDLHRIEANLCDVNCRGNRDQVCGGSKEDSFSIYYSRTQESTPLKSKLIRSDQVYQAILSTTRTTTTHASTTHSQLNITQFKNETFQMFSICELGKGGPCYFLPVYVTIGGQVASHLFF